MTTEPAVRPACSTRTRAARAVLVSAVAAPVILGLGIGPAAAGEGQQTAPMVQINSAGGEAADGSDGLALAFNADPHFAVTAGQDQINHRGGAVYEGEGAGPALDVGGVLIGQAGPAAFNASMDWDYIGVNSYSGAGSQAVSRGSWSSGVGTRSGGGTTEIEYQVTIGGLDYGMTRSIDYDGISGFFNESYQVFIPAGNTAQVSLYYGGNVAPDGTSADTYGFKIGDNGTQTFGERTLDGTYLAYRALPTGPFDDGEFDSYSVQQFDADYPAVAAGTDLSNMVDERAHDGGLLGAWDLGTAPGTYDRQVQVFAGKAQAALTGQFSAATAQVGDTVDYTIDVFNPFVAFLPGSQFDFTVPIGATVTTARSTCAGGMGFGGSPVVEVRGITARNMSSPCQVVVSMTFAAAGTATADASNVTNLGAADNQVTADSIMITGGTVVVPPPVPGPGPVTPPTTDPVTDPVTGTDPVVIPVTGTVPSATGTTQVTPQALATTGADTGPILALGAGLLAAGAGAVLVGRRRKAASN